MKKLTKKLHQNEGTLEAYSCSCYPCSCAGASSKAASYYAQFASYARMSLAIG